MDIVLRHSARSIGYCRAVLADYLGPNRTVTTTVSTCHVVKYRCAQQKDNSWDYKSVESWLCSNESKPWEGCSRNSPSCNSTNDGHTYCERQDGTETTTVTYDPATISGSVQNCTLQNGWCVSPANLGLSANEPLSGYSITLIEGTLNGGSFACPSGTTSCSLPLNEGENTFNYWALSSWGDSSLMGTSAARVDTVAPSVGLDISGTSGANGWYVSPLTITATGADAMPGSGVASRLLSIDGGATWQPALTLHEGVYKVDVTVFDNAGNVSTSATTLSVDTTTPSINMSVSGTLGKNGWYKSAIQVAGDPKDATSGVATFEVAVDGAAYQVYMAPISFSDGQHTIRFRACNTAGNCTETPQQTFLVDTIPPLVNLPSSWQLGTNVPYDVIDEGSGLAGLRIVIEDEDEKFKKVAWDQNVSGHTFSEDIDWDGKFKDGTVAPPGTYLVWLKPHDLAGNEKFYLGKVIVPESNLFLSLLPTEAPSTLASPVPPAELFEPDGLSLPKPEAVLPITAPPTTGFGGETTETTGTTTHSLLLATGSAGAAKSSSSSSGVLWGTMAAAAIGAASAYALDATRKRQEAEAAQATQVKAEVAQSKAERAEKKQKQQENYNKQQALEQAIQAYQQKKKQETAFNARMEERMAQRDQQEEANWMAAQAAVKKKDEDKKKAEAQQTKLTGYFNSEKQGAPKVLATPVPDDDPWWKKLITKATEVAKSAGQTAKETVTKAITTAHNIAKETGKTVQNVYEAAKKAVNVAVNTAVTAAQKTYEAAKNVANLAVNTAVKVAQKTYETVKNVANLAVNTAITVAQKTYETAKNVVNATTTTAQNAWNKLKIKLATSIDAALDVVYDYHGPVTPPSGVNGTLWLALPGISASTPHDYIFNHYYVDQQPLIGQQRWLSPNECVTAATIQEMNMMQDILAAKHGIPQIPHTDLPAFAAMYDSYGVRNWFYRPPADVPVIGGMLHPKNAEWVLNRHGDLLRANYGCGYTAELSDGKTVQDLIENLNNGYPTSIHVSQDVDLFKIKNGKVEFSDWRALIGGGPHTVTVAGYDATTDTWYLLDPSPYANYANTKYTEWHTPELMEKWGRRFIFYPPRFAMTTLIPDATCSFPPATSTPSGTPVSTSATTTGTPAISQTAQPASTSTMASPTASGTPATSPTASPVSTGTSTSTPQAPSETPHP